MANKFCGINSAKQINIRFDTSERGSLAFLETSNDIPFVISRIFYIYNHENLVSRGFHAHKLCSQVILCLRGSIDVHVDDGSHRASYLLDNPFKALYIPPSIWSEQNYLSTDSILLALADREYEENDYIRDYNDFIAYRNNLR